MTKSELVAAIAEKAGIRKKDAEAALNAFIEVVTETLKKGDKVEIRGFGTFLMKERAPRVARNPKTGEKVTVPARKKFAFKASKKIRFVEA